MERGVGNGKSGDGSCLDMLKQDRVFVFADVSASQADQVYAVIVGPVENFVVSSRLVVELVPCDDLTVNHEIKGVIYRGEADAVVCFEVFENRLGGERPLEIIDTMQDCRPFGRAPQVVGFEKGVEDDGK